MSTNRSATVGVIGGGLGGLAAACTLAARGYSVVLLEKNPWLGGKAALWEEQGFRFDMGPTILTLPSVLARIFDEAGRRLDDYLELVRIDPQWRSFFTDGTTLDLLADIDQMSAGLDAFSRGTGPSYRRFMEHSARLHRISDRFFFWRPVGGLRDMFDVKTAFEPSLLPELLAMRPGSSVAATVRSHVPDARVAQMLDHFTQYVGSAPDASPAVLCGIAHMQTSEGVWYPLGGTGAVPRALTRLATELGVEIRTGTGVRRILLTEDGGVRGVETEAGEHIPLDAVVSNSDAVRTHRELLGGKAATRFERRRRYEPACSGVVLYLGLDRRYDHLLHHNFVFSHDPEEEFEAIYRRGEPAADPTCYVCAPARTEPGVAPPGGEALYVLVHTPYLRPHHDWDRLFPTYRKTILEKLRSTGWIDGHRGSYSRRALADPCRHPSALRRPERRHLRHCLPRALAGGLQAVQSQSGRKGSLPRGWRCPPRSGDANGPDVGMDRRGRTRLRRRGKPGGSRQTPLGCRRPLFAIPRRSEVVLPSPEPATPADSSPPVLARRSPLLVRFFIRHVKRFYLARNFHAVRLSRSGRPGPLPGGPLIVVLNHPSWWDPLVGIVLTELFPDRSHFAPMDADALRRYRIFDRMGMFGVESGHSEGLESSFAPAAPSLLDRGPRSGSRLRVALPTRRTAAGRSTRSGASRTPPEAGGHSAAGSGVSLLGRALSRSAGPVRPSHHCRTGRRPIR